MTALRALVIYSLTFVGRSGLASGVVSHVVVAVWTVLLHSGSFVILSLIDVHKPLFSLAQCDFSLG